ncbi:MAG: hypothetical protein N2234_05670 [Planctomycetota bacterium]|nr:hypothetical protein [Planctomycetota bacterium]
MCKRSVVTTFVILMVFSLTAQEAQKPDVRKLVSEKGIIFFWTPDCERLRTSWRKSFLAGLLNDEEMKMFLESLKKANLSPSAFLDRVLRREIQMNLKDALSVFKGGLLLQLANLDMQAGRREAVLGDIVKFLFLLDSADSKPSLEKLLTNGKEAILRSAHKRLEKSTVDYKGIDVRGLGSEEAAFFDSFLGNIWALTFDLDGMKQVIDRFKAEGAATVLSDKTLNTALKASGLMGREEFVLWFDHNALYEKIQAAETPFFELSPDLRQILAKMVKITPNTLLVGAPDGEGYKEVAVVSYAEGVPQEFKESVNVGEKLLVEPEQILMLSAGGAGLLRTYLEAILEAARSKELRWRGEIPLDAFARKFEFDVEKDVLGQLRGMLQFYVVKPAGSGAWPEIFAVAELTDAEKIIALLEKVIEAAQKKEAEEDEEEYALDEILRFFANVKKHKVGDLTLFVFESERNGSADVPYAPSFGIIGKKLIFGTQPQVVRGVAKALKEPFEAGKFAEVLKKAQGKNQFVFINIPEVISYAYNTFIPLLRKTAARELEELGIDLSLLPDVKTVRKHFSPLTISSYAKENSIVIEAVTERGFGFTGSLISVVGYVSLCAMAKELDPEARLLERLRREEARVVGALKMLATAQETHKIRIGKYAENLDTLIKAGFFNEYYVNLETHKLTILGVAGDSWSAVANPKEGSLLKRYYFVNQTGVVRMSNTAAIGPDSPLFEPITEIPKETQEKKIERQEEMKK